MFFVNVFLDFFNLKLYLVLVQTVVLKVGMSCEGCVGAVKRVLGKMEGLLQPCQFKLFRLFYLHNSIGTYL
jgi:hypothetical protein